MTSFGAPGNWSNPFHHQNGSGTYVHAPPLVRPCEGAPENPMTWDGAAGMSLVTNTAPVFLADRAEYAVKAVIRHEQLLSILRFQQRGVPSPVPQALLELGYILWAFIWDVALTCLQRFQTLHDPALLRQTAITLHEEVEEYRSGVRIEEVNGLLGRIFEGDVPDVAAGRNAAVDLLSHALVERPEWNLWREYIQFGGDRPTEEFDRIASLRTELATLRAGRPRLQGLSTAELFEQAQPPSWLIHHVLVRGSTAYLAGPFKSIKSGISLDLVMALGLPPVRGEQPRFLGHFRREPARHVLVFSGEASPWEVAQRLRAIFAILPLTVQQELQRMSGSEHRDPATLLNATFYFDVPRMSLAEEQETVRREIRRREADVVIIDPLYLAALAGSDADASNVFEMGAVLRAMEDVVLSEGATPIFLHHFNKSVKAGMEPSLGHMAYSGSAERAAQWILLNHRVPFDPMAGHARLAMIVGGRAGQAGAYGVDIVEGRVNDDLTGRTWRITVCGLEEAKELDRVAGRTATTPRRATAPGIHRRRILQALLSHERSSNNDPICRTPLCRRLGMNNHNGMRELDQLRDDGLVEQVSLRAQGREHVGFRLTEAGREAVIEAEGDHSSSRSEGDGQQQGDGDSDDDNT
jgi:hypothetical protein